MRATDIDMLSLGIFKPFVMSVWMVLIFMIVIIGFLLSFFSKWETKEFKHLSLFLLSLAAFCQQGTNYKISLISTRFLITFLFIIGILSYNFYTSVLVSHLVNIKYESEVNSMDDLIVSGIPIGFYNSTVIRNYLDVNNLKYYMNF